MKRYYKIGELVKTYNIGRDAIKYYEELEILKPTRDKNGYRLYSIDDVCKLNLIRELRNLNIPMKEIKKYLEKRDVESTKKMLKEEMNIIENKIEILLNQKRNIQSRLKVIEQSINKNDFKTLKVKYYDERKALVVGGNVDCNESVDYLIQKLRKELEDNFYIIGNNNIGSIFDSKSIEKGRIDKYKHVIAFLEDDSEISNFSLKKGDYISCTYKGKYANNRKYLKAMYNYAKENGYKIVGDPIEIYDVDIYETSNEDEFITSLEVRIEKI